MARTILLIPIAALGFLGCASIIGLDDYRVAGGGAAGASGASGAGGAGGAGGHSGSSAGHAGASHAGGNSVAGAESGTGGQGGDSTLPGEGGQAGSGQGATIVGCDGETAFEPNQAIITSCLMRAGCNPTFDPIRNISTCVTYNTQAALPGESCNLDSTTCAEFEACEHVGVAHADLCGGGKKTRCEGGKAINCGNYADGDRFFDCGALGGNCGTYVYTDGETYADCKLDIAPDVCSSTNDDSRFFCHSATGKEDLRYYCWDGEAFGSSCSLGTCEGDPAKGDASCYFNLPECTTPTTPICNGDTATLCSGGQLFKYGCGKVGLACDISGSTEYCLAPGCSPADVDGGCTEHCSDDGSELTFCYGGAPYTVKCTDYGFTQCLAGMDDEDKPFAACRF